MSFKKDLPVMMSSCGQFFTQDGNFYQQVDYGIWKQIECYLPGSATTYGFNTQEAVARHLFTRLSTGSLVIKPKGNIYQFEDDRLKVVKRQANKALENAA